MGDGNDGKSDHLVTMCIQEVYFRKSSPGSPGRFPCRLLYFLSLSPNTMICLVCILVSSLDKREVTPRRSRLLRTPSTPRKGKRILEIVIDTNLKHHFQISPLSKCMDG